MAYSKKHRRRRSGEAGQATVVARGPGRLAFAKFFCLRAHALDHLEIEIGYRRVFLESKMTPGLERALRLAGEQTRVILSPVPTVRYVAGVKQHRVVQQR